MLLVLTIDSPYMGPGMPVLTDHAQTIHSISLVTTPPHTPLVSASIAHPMGLGRPRAFPPERPPMLPQEDQRSWCECPMDSLPTEPEQTPHPPCPPHHRRSHQRRHSFPPASGWFVMSDSESPYWSPVQKGHSFLSSLHTSLQSRRACRHTFLQSRANFLHAFLPVPAALQSFFASLQSSLQSCAIFLHCFLH